MHFQEEEWAKESWEKWAYKPQNVPLGSHALAQPSLLGLPEKG